MVSLQVLRCNAPADRSRAEEGSLPFGGSTVPRLQSQEQAALLDAIDQLRRENIDAEIGIPQIVVCGDQSSGKSSLLEPIAQVSFPIGSGAVTMCKAQYHVYHGICLRLSVDSTTSSNSLRLVDSTRVSIRILLPKGIPTPFECPVAASLAHSDSSDDKDSVVQSKTPESLEGRSIEKAEAIAKKGFFDTPVPLQPRKQKGPIPPKPGFGFGYSAWK